MINPISKPDPRISRNDLFINSSSAQGPSFEDRLKNMMQDVNDKQHKADADARQVIEGKLGIHEGMMSLSEADISLKYFLQVRSKVMQAYNDIIKMSI